MELRTTKTNYLEVPFNTSKYFEKCWIQDGAALDLWDHGDTSFVYSNLESIIFGIVIAIISTAGTILNFTVIMALLRSSELRNEYITPTIVSIAINDFLQNIYALPAFSLHFFTGDMLVPSCNFHNFVVYGIWICHAWNLVGVSLMRCFVIYFPEKMRKPAPAWGYSL